MIKNKVYCVFYRNASQEQLELYIYVTNVTAEFMDFVVTGVLADTKRFDMKYYCDNKVEIRWKIAEARTVYHQEYTPKELLKKGRCPTCGRLGKWGPRASLVCPVHNAFAGL